MILKHRDTEVLRFEWLEPDGVRVTSVNEKALQFLPLEMHGEPTDEPIFDNGYGLFSLALDRPEDPRNHEWDDLRKYARKIGPSLYLPWLAFPGGVTTAMKAAATKLNGFRFKRHPNYNLSVSRLRTPEKFLQNRARLIVENGEKADRLLLIDEKNGGELLTEFGGHDTLVLSEQILKNMSADSYISQEELSQILGVSLRRVQRQVAELKAQGRLQLAGTGRVKSWKVVYEGAK